MEIYKKIIETYFDNLSDHNYMIYDFALFIKQLSYDFQIKQISVNATEYILDDITILKYQSPNMKRMQNICVKESQYNNFVYFMWDELKIKNKNNEMIYIDYLGQNKSQVWIYDKHLLPKRLFNINKTDAKYIIMDKTLFDIISILSY